MSARRGKGIKAYNKKRAKSYKTSRHFHERLEVERSKNGYPGNSLPWVHV